MYANCIQVSGKKVKRRVIAVIAVITCLLVTGSWSQPGENATAIIRYTPPTNLPDRGREGYCWTNSIAAPDRPDAWRCMEGNAIHDPCFALSGEKAVVCGVNPASGEGGFKLSLTKALPEPVQNAPSGQPWPWLVELDDGTVCMRFTGTAPFLDGEAGHYGCSSKIPEEQILLMGDFNTRKPLWTARKAILVKSGSQWNIKSTESVPIKRIWK